MVNIYHMDIHISCLDFTQKLVHIFINITVRNVLLDFIYTMVSNRIIGLHTYFGFHKIHIFTLGFSNLY